MEKVIEMEEIYKIYGNDENEVRALNGINFTVDKGDFVSIIGTSGSGKSTLMNIIGCLDLPTSGSYVLDNVNVLNKNDKTLSSIRNNTIGFIFQGFNLISGLNALENVELPLMYRGIQKAERRKIAMEALEQVSLSNRLLHRPSQMSGGQQQRVAIARAVASCPQIILADEPTGNLDSKSAQAVIQILHNLNKDGKTIVLITHDNEVAKQANNNVRISDGNIIAK